MNGVVQVSAGLDGHGVVLRSDGTVWAVGRNFNAQLGDGTRTDRSTPVQVTAFPGSATQVAAGGGFTLALRPDGTVWSWGFNGNGALGDGTRTDRLTPVQVSGLTDVTQIDAGDSHAMALKSDGTVWTWGANGPGAIGDGSTANRLTPVQVPGLTDVVQVSGGGSFSLALKSDGTVWSWGANFFGQLGDGTTTNRLFPVQVTGLTGVIQISAGWGHSLALLPVVTPQTETNVVAWGNNGNGQLGDGTTTTRLTPVRVVDGLLSIRQVAAGGAHSFAVSNVRGDAFGWGRGDSGQVGDGFFDEVNTHPQRRALFRTDQISAGSNFTMGVVQPGGGP